MHHMKALVTLLVCAGIAGLAYTVANGLDLLSECVATATVLVVAIPAYFYGYRRGQLPTVSAPFDVQETGG